jgi:hypothetical protein
VRHHAARVEELHRAQAVALRAGAHRVVEREQARLELGERVVAHRAGEARREQCLFSCINFKSDDFPVREPQRGLERLGEALLHVGAHAQPVDHDLDAVL